MNRSFLTVLVLLTSSFILNAQALEHKPKQWFISPEISLGTSVILNQNNYGYSELGYRATFGGQLGVMVGWDYYLKQSVKTGILVTMWGQNYSDLLGQYRVEKHVQNYYLQLPFAYKYVFGSKRGYDNEVFSPYVFGSVRIGYLVYSNVDFFRGQDNGTLVEQDLVNFVSTSDWNENLDEILAMGNPSPDRELFNPMDIDLEVGGGYQFFITRRASLFAEVHFVSGILDINAASWRFRSNKGTYKASYNLYGGLKIGANIYLFKNDR